jgi:hypothetical protein
MEKPTSNNNQLVEPVEESTEEKLKRQRHQWYTKFYAKKKEQLLEKTRKCDICGRSYNYFNKRNHQITKYHKLAEAHHLEEIERKKALDDIMSDIQAALNNLISKTEKVL